MPSRQLRIDRRAQARDEMSRIITPSCCFDPGLTESLGELRSLFPQQAKVGSVEHIRDLVNLQLPGIALLPMPVAPRQIPYHAGSSYFELDRGSDHWKQLANSGGFAFHIAGQFPGLNLAFWAIRG